MNDDVCVGCGRSEVSFRGVDPDSGGRLCSNCNCYRRQAVCAHCGRRRRYAGLDRDGNPWCPTCQTAARMARLDAQARDRIIAEVCDADPGADRAVVVAVLDKVGAHVRTLRRIDRHLADNPDVFSHGPTHENHAVGRFVDALIEAGIGLEVSYVDCEDCGRNLLTLRTKGRMICHSCANKARAAECGRCAKVALVATRDEGGTAVCAKCSYDIEGRRQAVRRELDAEIVSRITAAGVFNKIDVIAAIGAVAPSNPQRRFLLVALKDEPPLGVSCRRRPNTTRFSDELRARGIEIPDVIRPIPRPGLGHRCPNCGRATNQANKTACKTCIAERLAAPANNCSRCGRQSAKPIDGLCGRCDYFAHRVCGACGVAVDLARRDGDRRCHRCLLATELDALIGVDPPDWVTAICSALRAAKSVASTRKWLAETPGGQLLSRLAAGDAELSHAELDRHTNRSVERLRGLLIVTEALGPDERRVDRLEEAVMAIAADITEPADRRIVESYLRWQSLPSIRRRAQRGASTVHSVGNLRQQTTVICRFVGTLAAKNKTLHSCSQSAIDEWFASPGTTAGRVTSFLNWAVKHRHLPEGLSIPEWKKSRQPTSPIDQQLRWADARRLVNDDSMNVDDRVAGALSVIYAQPLTRIAALTIDNVTITQDGAVTIAFENHQIDLAQPFASLARQLPVRRNAGAGDHLATRWLFPATRPDRPVHPATITNRLRRIGIDPAPDRLAAISQLASEIPPALLAESIGIGPRQASKWVGVSGGNWTNYAHQ